MGGDTRQLLVFSSRRICEGRLVGAVERIESGGAMRILAAMFVGRQPDGELPAMLAAAISADSST